VGSRRRTPRFAEVLVDIESFGEYANQFKATTGMFSDAIREQCGSTEAQGLGTAQLGFEAIKREIAGFVFSGAVVWAWLGLSAPR
jgi:hypothetical protein